MKTSAYSRFLTVLALCAALPACDDARRAVGYEKVAPDEFQIIQRAPLSVPPDFTLRPPAPGLVRPQEGTTSDQAKSTLLGTGGRQLPTVQVSRDNSDNALLKRAGVDQARRDIRELIDKESLAQANSDKGFTDKLLFWKEKPGESLNPGAEYLRLHGGRVGANGVTGDQSPQTINSNSGGGPRSAIVKGLWEWLTWPLDE
jgi:hypothetical protein